MGGSKKGMLAICALLVAVVAGVFLAKRPAPKTGLDGAIGERNQDSNPSNGGSNSGRESSALNNSAVTGGVASDSSGNAGSGNVGSGNVGSGNAGSGNSGSGNAGSAVGGAQGNKTGDGSSAANTPSDSSTPQIASNSNPKSTASGMDSPTTGANKATQMLPASGEAPTSAVLSKPIVDLRSPPSKNGNDSAANTAAKNVATVNPSLTRPEGAAPPPIALTPVQKKRPNFPGIIQAENRVMVSDVKHKGGEGEDLITVTLTQTDGIGEVSGKVWVIGEYIQRGTDGVMFMPSHNELKLAPDGTPKNPNSGMDYRLKTSVDRKIIVRRPGFDGEELVGVRIGVMEKDSGQIHIAKISMTHIQKRPVIKRVKVNAQEATGR
jgi:Pentapeptide repeats (8 copies)